MNQELQTRNQEPADSGPPTLRLKPVPFFLAMHMIGLTTPTEQARLLGVDVKWLKHATAGGGVGGRFISQTINAFRLHADALARVHLDVNLDQFFEVPAAEQAVGAAA